MRINSNKDTPFSRPCANWIVSQSEDHLYDATKHVTKPSPEPDSLLAFPSGCDDDFLVESSLAVPFRSEPPFSLAAPFAFRPEATPERAAAAALRAASRDDARGPTFCKHQQFVNDCFVSFTLPSLFKARTVGRRVKMKLTITSESPVQRRFYQTQKPNE